MLIKLLFVVLFHEILALEKEYYDVENSENLKALFENFLREFNKSYTGSEKTRRLQIFYENLKDINSLNANYPPTIFGINHFTDLTDEEMECYYGFDTSLIVGDGDGLCTRVSDPQTHDAPVALDWRDQNAVTPVKYQQTCGSCWAFSATATVESNYAMSTGQQVDLSEQQLVDCDDSSNGCLGGYQPYAFSKLIQEGGQELEANYPYVNQNGSCQFDSSKVAVKVTGCITYVPSSEDTLKEFLAKTGPLSISVAGYPLGTYKGGVYTNCDNHTVNHGIQLIGYGSENGLDFWIIKNSWNTAWGEGGFGRIQRGINCLGLLDRGVSTVTAVA